MLISMTAVLFAALPFSLAQSSCTTSNAVSWASNGDDNGSDDILGSTCSTICGTNATCLQQCNSDPCAEQFGDDAAALQACYATAQQGECNAVGGSACDTSDISDTNDPSDLIKKLKTRATLTCSSSETCYKYTDGSLFCLDKTTGDYQDDVGGTGNVNTGDYIASDGSSTNVYATATATATSTRAPGASAAASNARISTTSGTTITTSAPTRPATNVAAGASSTSSGSSTSTAAATANLGLRKQNVGHVIGALGLVAAFVL